MPTTDRASNEAPLAHHEVPPAPRDVVEDSLFAAAELAEAGEAGTGEPGTGEPGTGEPGADAGGSPSDFGPAGSTLGEVLRHPLNALLARQVTRAITPGQSRNLLLFWLDGIWSSASEGFSLAYIPLYALAYGANAAQVGLIASIGNLTGALALFPGARILDKTDKRKEVVVVAAGIVGRAPLLLLAFLPFLPLSASAAIFAILVLNAVRSMGFNFVSPAWTAITADLVPVFMRGRYFSLRNFLMGLATLIAPPIAGLLIAWGRTGPQPLRGYQIAFLIAWFTGALSTWYFWHIRDPGGKRTTHVEGKRPSWLASLRTSRAFAGFVFSAFVWNLALQIASPYFNIYLVTGLGGTETTVGVVTAISALTGLVGQVIFGRVVDRKGSTWVFLATGFAITLLPMAWAFYNDTTDVAINNIFGGFLWAGFNLATFNLLLLLTPDDQRPRATALFQFAVFGGSVIGPLVGGYIADAVSYPAVFLTSGVGRLTAMILFVIMGARAARVQERKIIAGTRHA